MALYENEQLPYPPSAIQEWAQSEFPEEFNTLPSVETLDFLTVGDDVVDQNTLPVILRLGTYQYGRLTGKDELKEVYVCVCGVRLNSIKFVLKGLDTTDLDFVNQDCFGMEAKSMVFADPFRKIISKYKPSATIARTRALVCYYYMCAGYVHRVGGYKAYSENFYQVCTLIAGQGSHSSRPFGRLQSLPRDHSKDIDVTFGMIGNDGNDDMVDTVETSESESDEQEDVDEFEDSDGVEDEDSSAEGTPYPPRTRRRRLHKAKDDQQALPTIVASINTVEKECRTFLRDAKRLKRDIQTFYYDESDLSASNETLICEKLSLQRDLEIERKLNTALRDHRNILANDEIAKANAGRDEAEKTIELLKKELCSVKGELSEKDASMAKLLEAEKQRADEAEQKLAAILSVFGQAH